MTNEQIIMISRLMKDGMGYRRIAAELNLPVNSVKSWCRRHPCEEVEANHCMMCGKEVYSMPHKKRAQILLGQMQIRLVVGASGKAENQNRIQTRLPELRQRIYQQPRQRLVLLQEMLRRCKTEGGVTWISIFTQKSKNTIPPSPSSEKCAPPGLSPMKISA